MKKSLFYICLLLLSCLASYHLGRDSKEYNWDDLRTTVVKTTVVSSSGQKQQHVADITCKPTPETQKNIDSDTASEVVIEKKSDSEETLLSDFSFPKENGQDTNPLLKTDFIAQNFIDVMSEQFEKTTDSGQFVLPSAEVAKKTIEKLPPHTIAEHLQRTFKHTDLTLIDDQHQFAQSLAQEYLDENPSRSEKPSYPSTVHFSLSKKFHDTPTSDFQFTKKSRNIKIFAHLKMHSSVVNNSHIFVKWMNLSNGKIMLFDKKRISANSNQNWVSLKPENGWKPGAYKIKLYQFNASLTPIVEGQYYVHEKPDN